MSILTILKIGSSSEFKKELKNLRATRVPSKFKKESRRKYAKKHAR